MQDAEVEDGIEGRVGERELLDRRDAQGDTAVVVTCEVILCACDLLRIKVDAMNPRGTEVTEKQRESHATTAAGLQHPSPGSASA